MTAAYQSVWPIARRFFFHGLGRHGDIPYRPRKEIAQSIGDIMEADALGPGQRKGLVDVCVRDNTFVGAVDDVAQVDQTQPPSRCPEVQLAFLRMLSPARKPRFCMKKGGRRMV